MMYNDNGEYLSQRDYALRASAREQFSAPKIQQQASTLRRLGQMPWPRNQFGEPESIVDLVGGAAQPSGQAAENFDLTTHDHADIT